ncbi:MAG: SBBP repeat-containing protein [Nitrososphaera sp.]
MKAFIRKYNSDGNEKCTRQFGTSGIDAASGVSADSSGGVYVAGETDGIFPGQTSEEETDAFLAKFAIDHDHGDKKKKDHDHDAKKKR